MTREEQLFFCNTCLNRKMDMRQGLVCSLTGEKATFQNECPDYKRDTAVLEVPVDNKEPVPTAELKAKLDPEIIEGLRLEQKLIPGLLAGLVVGLVGAVLWGVLTVATNYQIGYMAVAIGAGVGLAIRKFGNGIDSIFGYSGAGIALFSVLLGNFLSIIGFIASAEGLAYVETLLLFNYAYLPEVMAETFNPIDLLFYGIAVYEGYKFSFRLITEKNLMELRQKHR